MDAFDAVGMANPDIAYTITQSVKRAHNSHKQFSAEMNTHNANNLFPASVDRTV